MTRSRLTSFFAALASIVIAIAATPSCDSNISVFAVTGAGGSGGGGGNAQGGGGAASCNEAGECPGLDTDCRTRSCDDGTCGFANAPLGTICDDGGGKSCDGDGACVECVTASDCDGEQCVNQICVPAQCVNAIQDGDETDVDCGGPSCAPCSNGLGCNQAGDCLSGFCNAGICASCGDDGDCLVPGTYCDAGVCNPQKGNGDVCAGANECASGFCPGADGVCCDSACTSLCEACLAAKTNGANGACDLVAGGTDPDGECGTTPVATCGANGTGCTGNTNGCNLYPSGTQCQPGFCSNAVQNAPSQCNGSGQCNPGPGLSCSPFGCNAAGTSCASSCSNLEPCAPGFVCQGGNCVPPLPNGQPCTQNGECLSGSCADNVCCNAACDGQCQACVQSKTGSPDGSCAAVSAGTDPDTECTDTGGPCGANGTGCNGLSISPGCNGYSCSCGQQYTHPNVFEVCPAVSLGQCRLRVTTVGASCDTICEQGGGECISAVNDNPNGTCNPSTQTLSCAQQNFSSMICICSSGCGSHASCTMPLTCNGGICE